MSYYPALKQRLTCREVAPRYGLKVNTSGIALCPFHDEHSPSLKLSRGFHCFGCGAQGDVITFVSRLFGIPPGEAAQKLSADFVIPAAKALRDGQVERAILLGGSGNGEAIAANRIKGVRCCLCLTVELAKLARMHNDSNAISLGQRIVQEDQLIAILKAWLETPFEGGRHIPRLEKIESLSQLSITD